MSDDAKKVFAGFWARLFAFILDSLILALPCLAVGFVFFDQLAAIEGPTRLIGLVPYLLYFGLLSSSLGGGATLGMRMMGLRVVDMRARPLDPVRALWRALVLTLPLILNGLYLQIGDSVWARAYVVLAAVCVYGVNLAQVILLIFNGPSRRLVHDYLSGSAVVRKGTEALPPARSFAPKIAFAVILLALAGGLWATIVAEGEIRPAARPARTAVDALPEVMESGVQDNTSTVLADGKSTTTHSLIVTARLRSWPKDENAEVARVGEAALKDNTLEADQHLRVVLRYGFDIGVASGWRSYANDYPPDASTATPVAPPAPGAPPSQPTSPQARIDALTGGLGSMLDNAVEKLRSAGVGLPSPTAAPSAAGPASKAAAKPEAAAKD